MDGKHTFRLAKQFPGYHKKAFRRFLNDFEGLDKLDFFVRKYYNLKLINSIEELLAFISFLQIQGVISLKEDAENIDTTNLDKYFD